MWNIIFLVTGAIFIALLLIIFFSKEVIDSKENKFFKALIIVNLIEYFIEIPLQLFVRGLGIESIMVDIFSKLYLAAIFTWFSFFSIYTFIICLNKKDEKKYEKQFQIIKTINLIIWVVGFVFLTIVPFSKFHEGDKMYIYGGAVDLLKLFLGIYMLAWIILLIKNIKNIKEKKYAPIFLVLLLLGINTALQTVDPSILIASMIGTFVCYIMFFTIENPDLKVMRELELAKDHAEKANRAKSDFLSSMSHEIRTPLNAIVGFSEMIETEDSIEACKEDAKDIVLASHTLLEIVNGILDISKIEANKMEIVNKEYNFLPELENLAKLMVPRIGEKDLKLVSNFAPDIPAVLYGDIGKIKEVITNLLTNAVKYTDSGTINFNVSCINDKEYSSFVISVEDTGRGIKSDHIDKLFTKFQRLEEDRNTTIEGTGLGLAITKNLVEMMGGKIVVQSEYGKGSIFTVYLKQKIVKLHEGATASEVAGISNHDFSGKKVLVVDDNSLNLKLAKRLLANYNLEIDTCDNGADAIEKVKENTYDLILLDDMMPKMRGIEALPKMKEIEGFNTPVVALTANSLSGMREVYLNAGFKDYLAKPIEKNELNKVLDKYLNSNSVKDYSDKKILIVDDNKINIKIASKILKTYNFDIDEAYNGQECIDKVKENKYDIIFMDYMMPGMNGVEAFNKLREIEGFDTPVVVLTADVVDNAKEKFMKDGFKDYISKPIDQKYLKEVIEKLIK